MNASLAPVARQAPREQLAEEYAGALHEYLTTGGEAALGRAYNLGRTALADGWGLLDMAELYQNSFEKLRPTLGGDLTEKRSRAADFYGESLSPFEMAFRGFREANIALRHINQMLEQEARRIAHSLHDEAGQLLAAVYMSLDAVTQEVPAAQAEKLQEMRTLLDEIQVQLRRLSHELRPAILDDVGLVPALEFLSQGVSRRTGLNISVHSTLDRAVPSQVALVLYRVVQEAFNNINKHARASRVSVRLTEEGSTLRCAIEDNGIGFDVNAALNRSGDGSIGLIGMRERVHSVGGTLSIHSAPAHGTELLAVVHLDR